MHKLNQKLIGFITLFENLTGAKIKDAFIDKKERVVFIVNEGHAGKAIGKHGSNIKRISGMIKKNIKVIEFSDNVTEFIKSIIDPIKADSYDLNDNMVIINSKDLHIKAMLIGRDKRNLIELNELVKRYFKNIEVKIG